MKKNVGLGFLKTKGNEDWENIKLTLAVWQYIIEKNGGLCCLYWKCKKEKLMKGYSDEEEKSGTSVE